MHILIAFVGLLSTAGLVLWRLNVALQASRQLADHVGDPRKLVRRARWARKSRRPVITALTDPRESAAVLLLHLADSAANHQDRQAGEAEARSVIALRFDLPETEADGLVDYASFLTKDLVDLTPRLRAIVRPICERCTPEERRELVAMAEAVLQASGATPVQQDVLRKIEQHLAGRG
ncbi:MAG: hypothetical protein AAGF19_01460 [Pseudomonadota bacterium]